MSLQSLETLWKDFRSTLKADVRCLVRLHNKDLNTVGRPGEWLKSLRRSAVVLTVANLEKFIEDTVVEGLSELSRNQVLAIHFPEPYRLWVFKRRANMRNVSFDVAKEFVDLSRILFSSTDSITIDQLEFDDLRETFANPTEKNINWLMSLLGHDEYLTGIQIEVQKKKYWATSMVGQMAKRRNDIAHGDSEQDPSIDTVERLVKFCQLFSTRFKKDVTKTIEACLAAQTAG